MTITCTHIQLYSKPFPDRLKIARRNAFAMKMSGMVGFRYAVVKVSYLTVDTHKETLEHFVFLEPEARFEYIGSKSLKTVSSFVRVLAIGKSALQRVTFSPIIFSLHIASVCSIRQVRTKPYP